MAALAKQGFDALLHIGLPASIVVFDDAQVEPLDEEAENSRPGSS